MATFTRTTRKDTNTYLSVDIAPELDQVLRENGMQAHISLGENGGYQLVTMSHNTSQPRHYDLTNEQLEKLVAHGGVNDKLAYKTFVSIVKDDYYCPQSYAAARNVYSPVQMGLYGYRRQRGEYNYFGGNPFSWRHYGLGDGYFHPHGWGPGHYNYRRIGGRLFIDNGAPVMAERPDGRLKPGELRSGSYGFYDKGNQSWDKDALEQMQVQAQPAKLNELTEEEKKKVTLLNEYIGKKSYNKHLLTGSTFNDILHDHGITFNAKDKTLTIKAKGLDRQVVYHNLTDEQVKILSNDKIKIPGEKGHKGQHMKDGNSVPERLKVINDIISVHFDDKVTTTKLNEKDLVTLKPNAEFSKQLAVETQQPTQQQASQMNDVIDMKNMREDYRTGFVDRWNTIGVVDGRAISEDKGFYLPVKGGRAVSVGEIQAYVANDGKDRGETFKMSAVINGKVYTHDISKEDYYRFLNYDDEHRLELFDKNFKEVQIKSSRNGAYTDSVLSGMLSDSLSSNSLKGMFSFMVDGQPTTITQATAWKDEVSGNYVLNVRDGRDAGMWTVKLTEQQYLDFCNAKQFDKAKMLETLMPWKDDMRGKVKVVPTQMLAASERVDEAVHGNVPRLSDKVLGELDKTKGLGYEPKVTVKQEVEVAKEMKEDLKKEGLYVEKKTETRLVNGENLNLSEIREQTRINLTGQASVNGESLDNIKESKEWKRAGENGRDTTVGDIAVEQKRGADGRPMEGKYIMSAVIDGVVVTHEINQKQYDKFLAVNDYQRMKLFDKIFPEVQMKTKEGHGFHLGAAILAALTVGTEVAMSLGGSRPPHPKPEMYGSVFSKPGVIAPGEVASALYEDKVQNDIDRAANVGMGRGM